MKKTIGWILIILGGFFCFVSILCIPAAFFTNDAPLKERIFLLITLAGIAFVNRLLCRLGFKLKGRETSASKQCFLTKLGRIMMFAGIGGGVFLAVPLALVFSVGKGSLVGMMALVVSTAGLILGVIGVIIDKIRREEAAAEEDTKYKCAQPQEDLNDARYQAEQMFQRGGLDREQAYAAYGLDSDGNKLKCATDEKRNCAAVLLTLETSWGGRAEHGEQKLTLTHQDAIYCLNLTSREWNDAGGCSTLQGNSTKCVGELKAAERHRWTVSGFLFHAKTLRGLPVWAAKKLAQEKVFTELFTPPYGGCREKTGQVYWSNWRDPKEYCFIWFEKQDDMWHSHSDVCVGGIQIKKDTPLPDATDKNIARCLELDSMIYLNHPDIEKWIQRD